MKYDSTWRKGDDAWGRDPWRPDLAGTLNWKEAVYPQWWFDPENPQNKAEIGDDLDHWIEKEWQ